MMLRVAWQMTKVNLWGLVRDRKALIMLFGLPVVLMFILSFALSGVFGSKGLPAFNVVVVNQDGQAASTQLIDVLKSQKGLIHVKTAETIAQARNQVNAGGAVVDLWIHKGFTEQIAAGKTGTVSVEVEPGHETDGSIVQSIVSSFGEQSGVMRAMTASHGGVPATAYGAAIHIDTHTSPLKPITSGAYYAIGMMAMFMLTHAMSRAEATVEEKHSDRYKRLLASPSSRLALTGGHWLSNFLVLALQGAILLLCARWLLNIHLGPVIQTGMLVLAYAASLAGISSVLGAWMKNQQAVDGLGGIGSQVAAVLGGSIFPIYGFPKFMQYIAHVLPNGRVVSALVNSVMGISASQLMVPICYLICLGICLGLLATMRYGQPAR
ncbi:ABC transporter permease [Alicyclobacillus herbarius]|uniref:ABC transporter permease n=1 Tax=Alicyclobacillus herbarius TaxID=122960 RepID=UPI00041F868E|nr:ABC transporter permease [Alicyclobacillus herbarius]